MHGILCMAHYACHILKGNYALEQALSKIAIDVVKMQCLYKTDVLHQEGREDDGRYELKIDSDDSEFSGVFRSKANRWSLIKIRNG